MFSYEVLRIIWWVLLGTLLIGFAIMDGFDLGAQMLVPFAGRTEKEKRIVINTIGPVWEGNQVWFILGGGAIFAAWPVLYAVAFSGFYLAMMLVLSAFIMRPVAFKFRSKYDSEKWRCGWDYILSASGFVIALVAGVAVGNVLQGVPFHFDDEMRIFYTGNFFQLLNPFAVLCGLLSVCMMLSQGGLYLATKTTDDIRARSVKIARITALLSIVIFISAGLLERFVMSGYELISDLSHNGPSLPLGKDVGTHIGAWMGNYIDYPWMLVAPVLGAAGALGVIGLANVGRSKLAFISNSISIFGIIATVGLSMFPFILPSSTNPAMSLMVWDSSSSQLALELMLFATVVFLPIVLAYTSWVFYVLRGQLSEKFFDEHKQDMY